MFRAVSLTKNANIDKYKYSGYGIGFDRHGEFSFGNGLVRNCIIFGFDKHGEFSFGNGLGRNCIIFGADLSSSSHANNKENNILVVGKDFVQGIAGTTINAEGLHKINFFENNKKVLFVFAL